MTARQAPSPTSSQRVRASALAIVTQGRVHGAKITAAEATRSQATPRTPTAGNRSTAKDGPR